MSEEVVRYELRGHVALATIDRPEARNAISPEVAAGIEAALDRIEGDDEVWVGILTGTPPSFSAGADLKAIGAGRGPSSRPSAAASPGSSSASGRSR